MDGGSHRWWVGLRQATGIRKWNSDVDRRCLILVPRELGSKQKRPLNRRPDKF